MSVRLAMLLLGLAALVLSPAASAWGREGHKVVALIAYHYLAPAVRQQVDSMLASDNTQLTSHNLTAEALWADAYRDSDSETSQIHYNATRQWHYIDLEIGATPPSIAKACYGHPPLRDDVPASQGPAKDCIVDKINEFEAELKDKNTRPHERLLALKYLLHFVADIHQPLHASDNHDKGGNDETVVAGGDKPASLHAYWDSVFVERLGSDPGSVALKLIVAMNPMQTKMWRQGYPADWAFGSFRLAKKVAYGMLPRPGEQHIYRLDKPYVREATRVVKAQLQKAGIRLAWLLDKALDQ